METKHYELRKLSSKDIFPMSKIISKIGIKQVSGAFQNDTIKEMINGGVKDVTTLGVTVAIDIAGIIFENLSSCEKEIYAFLANLSGATIKELQELPIADFTQMIIDLVQKEEFADFFKVVSKLFKSEK